jgi:hypothetical protein
MCIRHGIGPGHKDWPELSRAIVAFGGHLKGFRAGAPPRGLHWWENPGVIPGMRDHSLDEPSAATVALLKLQADANGLPPGSTEVQAVAVHAPLPAAWLAASRQHVFARAGPHPSTGPPHGPGLSPPIMSDRRGRSMASPAALIRAGCAARCRPGTAHPIAEFDPRFRFRIMSDAGR